MKIIMIGRVSPYDSLEDTGINAYNYFLFHGEKERGSGEALLKNYSFGREVKFKGQLSRNIRYLPDIIFPSINLMVSKKTLDALTGTKNLDCYPVPFGDQYDTDFKDTTPYVFDDFKTVSDIRKELPKAENPIESPYYYELLCPKYSDIALSEGRDVQVRYERIESKRKPLQYTIRLSASLFDAYPVLRHDHWLLRYDVFKVIEDFFDPLFFYIKEIEI